MGSRPARSLIDAPASAVWPWLAQMGPAPRGGAYTYDWIENLLGLDMHSADQVLPEFQHPAVGDTIGLGANRMRIERVEPRARPRLALGGRQLGLGVRPRRAGRLDALDQPQPVPAADARGPDRNGSDGAWLARDGTEDAARDQAARRASCALGSSLRSLLASSPTARTLDDAPLKPSLPPRLPRRPYFPLSLWWLPRMSPEHGRATIEVSPTEGGSQCP